MAACTLCSPPRAQTVFKKISKTSKLFSPSYYLGLVFHTAHSLKYWVKSFKRCNVVLSCAKTEFCRSTNYSLATALPEQIAFSIFTPSDFLLFELPVLCSAIMETAVLLPGAVGQVATFSFQDLCLPQVLQFQAPMALPVLGDHHDTETQLKFAATNLSATHKGNIKWNTIPRTSSLEPNRIFTRKWTF